MSFKHTLLAAVSISALLAVSAAPVQAAGWTSYEQAAATTLARSTYATQFCHVNGGMDIVLDNDQILLDLGPALMTRLLAGDLQRAVDHFYARVTQPEWRVIFGKGTWWYPIRLSCQGLWDAFGPRGTGKRWLKQGDTSAIADQTAAQNALEQTLTERAKELNPSIQPVPVIPGKVYRMGDD